MLNAQNQAYNTLTVNFFRKTVIFYEPPPLPRIAEKREIISGILNVKENRTRVAVPQNAMRNFAATLKTYKKITTKIK